MKDANIASTRKQVGALGEKIAARYLKQHSYSILETNYRTPEGEIDIVARHKDCLVFVEVRTKTSACFGIPEESITRAKIQKLIAMASQYRQTHENLPEQWRIDVVAIELYRDNRLSRIEVIENAVCG